MAPTTRVTISSIKVKPAARRPSKCTCMDSLRSASLDPGQALADRALGFDSRITQLRALLAGNGAVDFSAAHRLSHHVGLTTGQHNERATGVVGQRTCHLRVVIERKQAGN